MIESRKGPDGTRASNGKAYTSLSISGPDEEFVKVMLEFFSELAGFIAGAKMIEWRVYPEVNQAEGRIQVRCRVAVIE